MEKIASWTKQVLGHRITATGGVGGQCVDLANDYLVAVYGLPPVRANAVDWYRHIPVGFVRIANTPDNFPQSGDLVVWGESKGAGTGGYGHIAVSLVADEQALVTVDQNWRGLERAAVVAHQYTGVLGWLRRA